MLGVAGRATIAAGEYLAFVEQGMNHDLTGLRDMGSDDFHGLLFGFDTCQEKLADTGLHVH